MCINRYLLTLALSIFFTSAQATDNLVELIANNKEPVSSSLSQGEIEDARKLFDGEQGERIAFAFKNSLSQYFQDLRFEDGSVDLRALCELKFLNAFVLELDRQGISSDLDSLKKYFQFLRASNVIDDLLFEIMSSLADQKAGLEEAGRKTGIPWFLGRYEDEQMFREVELDWVFESFTPWRAEGFSCFYSSYDETVRRIKDVLGISKGASDYYKKFNFEAFNQGVLDEEAFWQLEYIRKNNMYKQRQVSLTRYLGTLMGAKDTMRPENYQPETAPIEIEDPFVAERLSRWKKISRRKNLYRKYTAHQIIMLAQVLEKASRRMGTDPDVESSIPVIIQEFSFIDEMGVRQNYVERTPLDSQSQYNYARRRMRMDIVDLQNMSSFAGVRIEYSDIVTAALETGYITHEDISYVLAYDDLWNPEPEPWRRLKNFCFSLGRTSILYLPAPYNIVGTIGLAALQGFLADNNNKGASNDNPATIIE